MQDFNEPNWGVLKLMKLKENLDAKRAIKKKMLGVPDPSSSSPFSPTSKKIFSHPPPPKSLTNTPTKQKVSVQDNPLQCTAYKNTTGHTPIYTPTYLPQLLLNQSKRKEIKVQKHRWYRKKRKKTLHTYLRKTSPEYPGNRWKGFLPRPETQKN